MDAKEIIDLTASDDHEVIVLESGDENEGPSTKRPRRMPSNGAERTYGETYTDEKAVANGSEQAAESTKKKKTRGKSRRKKRSVVGAEDGEIVEVDVTEDSGQVSMEPSRAESRERAFTGESSKSGVEESSKDTVDRTVRSLLDRLGDADDHSNCEDVEIKAQSSKEKKKRKKKRKRTDDKPKEEMGDLFFVDEAPAEVPVTEKFAVVAIAPTVASNKAKEVPQEDQAELLLPAHVSILERSGDAPIQIIAPVPPDSDDEDFIEYLDYDDDRRFGVARYFDDPTEIAEAKASRQVRIVCKHCGEEGDHKARDCPVLICLTCGARDEHSTRGCPISKTCFSCGMKGHINKDCPNRYRRMSDVDKYYDCDRCGASVHRTQECPTLWRIYEYVDDPERLQILHDREEMRDLELGEGGEGYIGPDDWCYYCGKCGHLGDDCDSKKHNPYEPSAFGKYNIDSGPFADAGQPEGRKPSKAAMHAAEVANTRQLEGHESYAADFADALAKFVPDLDVGKQARKKEKARLEKQALRVQEDDGEDWFANRDSGRGSKGSRNGGGTPKGPRNSRSNIKVTFGNLGKDDDRYGGRDRRDNRRDSGQRRERDERSRYDDDLPGPSRETDSIQIRGAARKLDRDDWDGTIRGAASRRRDDYDGRRRERESERSRYDDRYDDRDHRRERSGRGTSPRREPRYRGGYSRR